MKSISLLIAIMIFSNVAFTSLVNQSLKVKILIPLSSNDLAGTTKEVDLTLAIQIDDPNESSSSDASNQDNNQADDATSSTNSDEIDPTEPTNTSSDFTESQENSYLECAYNYFIKYNKVLSTVAKENANDYLDKYKTGEKSLDSGDETECVHFLTDSTG